MTLDSSIKKSGSSTVQLTYSVAVIDTIMRRYPLLAIKWAYEWGVVLKGIEQVWLKTYDQRYFEYIKSNIDEFVDANGNIRTYHMQEFNLDHINTGKLLFGLFRETNDSRYRQAAFLLRKQLKEHPRTDDNGFWHKNIYPHQMWLDGIYMQAPFYAEFAKTFDKTSAFDDIANQIILIESKTRDPKTGLLYHGWDESKKQRWADPITGCSPHFWGRAMGWYMIAIPDTLEHFPDNHPARDKIIEIFVNTISALLSVQDSETGLWYQVLDRGNQSGNYLEASASCMIVYAIAKGVRQGYLDQRYLGTALKSYQGIIENFIEVDEEGCINLNQICSVAGLGGIPYRDGSFEYYVSEPIATNDYKGVGAFIMASSEIEHYLQR